MTINEVIKLIGQPRSKDSRGRFNYGNVWIIFEGSLVGCLVKAEDFVVNTSFGIGDCRGHYSSIKIKGGSKIMLTKGAGNWGVPGTGC
jgi:hypothetical protein